MATTLSLLVLGPNTSWTQFLHGTSVGRKFVNLIWSAAGDETVDDADFDVRHARNEFDN